MAEKTRFRLSKHADDVVILGGKAFSSFGYLLAALASYVCLCFLTYAVLRTELGSNQGASFITFEIATGGDPYNFKELAFSHPLLWLWILILHLLSWLMIPILAATAVDAANRKWEERLKWDIELLYEMRRILKAYAEMPQGKADDFARQFLEEAEIKLASTKPKE